MATHFDSYLRKLRETPLDEHTEHTGRSALEALLNTFAETTHNTSVQHEPKREADKGAPDFKIKRKGMILGYVEVKEIGSNLDKVLKSDQIKRYRTLSGNILLTDYLQWVWIDRERVKGREILAYPTDLESRTLRIAPERAEAVGKLIGAFFSEAPQGIGRAQQLALALATRSQLLRDFLTTELTRQAARHVEGRLHALYEVFRQQIFHELTTKEFADAFAQMLAYGLFLARLNAGEKQTVTLENVRSHIPGSFRLIRELVRFLEEMNEKEYVDARWIVDEVLSIVNGLDLPTIHEDLSFRQRKAITRKVRAGDEEEHRLFERDPFIYFYEDYLRAYDKETSKGRGVYYTPPPIVNFIVRAVDDILKDTLNIKDGLADHRRVTVLDFACGTGTFLLETFQRIFENIGGAESGRADPVVREHLLKNIYGFEYLIAPYTIAHLKLSQYLKDQDHPLGSDERLQIYLTNTLEPVDDRPPTFSFVPALAEEARRADEVKDKPILVILGNPPYSGHSKNKGAWITAEVAKYRDGISELSKPGQGKWLQDDYVKFIRFAQMKMDEVKEGVVGIITNHSWLDNPTFRGMRKSLMSTFNQIYVLDLHGNSKKKERDPDGSEDQNVFDIEQGVAISLFIKGTEIDRGVWHGEFWGKRLAKYQAAALGNKGSIGWTRLEPDAPDWVFKVQDQDLGKLYRKFWSVPDIYSSIGDPAPGIVTTHDEFAISFTSADAVEKIRALLATANEREARKLFRLCSQKQWSYETAKTELPDVNLSAALTRLHYRPFDTRWTIWDSNVAVHRRERVMRHMLSENVAITTSRQSAVIGSPQFDGVMVVDRPVDFNFYRRGGEYVFPAYLNPTHEMRDAQNAPRRESLSAEFRVFLDQRYDHHYTPEEVLGYIYAVLYAPTYRIRYGEFLRSDFPRVPFPESADDFEKLSKFGWALVQAHLLRELPRKRLAAYHGKGDHMVEAVRYAPTEEAISINKTQFFTRARKCVGVPHRRLSGA